METDMRFDGKGVIVTGAGSGIGLATARRFVHEGARVLLAGRGADRLAAAVEGLAPGARDRAFAQPCDVGTEADVIAAVDAAFAHCGRLDVVVNNAAIMVFKPIEDLADDDFLRVLHVNLLGAFRFTREVFRRCAPGACVVNVASIHARQTSPLVSSYAAAKGALVAFTRAAAIEGRPLGMRVNVVLPGAIETPMLRENPNLSSGAEVLDERDVGAPEDVAGAIAWLASDEARFVTGAEFVIDGGRLARL